MGITVAWEKEDAILRVDFGDIWDEDEYFAAVEEANAMVQAAGQRVDVILNAEHGSLIQPHLDIFKRGKKTLTLMPENVGAIIIVSSSTFSRALLATVFKVYRNLYRDNDVRAFDSMQEALAYLAERVS